jgi:multidrug resistance efflux pump
VTTRVPGWIETLYVDSTGKLVHKGEPLFDFYSPDLYLRQREYLLALVQGDAAAAPVLNKLYHLGLSVGQIEKLRTTHQVPHTLQIVSPQDGVVVEKNALQGTMTEPGKTLYRIGDIGKVWVLAEIYEQDLPFLQVGQEAVVKLSYMADRSFRGKVTYIYPTVEEKTRNARVRRSSPIRASFSSPVCSLPWKSMLFSRPRPCLCPISPFCAVAKRTPSSWRWKEENSSHAKSPWAPVVPTAITKSSAASSRAKSLSPPPNSS